MSSVTSARRCWRRRTSGERRRRGADQETTLTGTTLPWHRHNQLSHVPVGVSLGGAWSTAHRDGPGGPRVSRAEATSSNTVGRRRLPSAPSLKKYSAAVARVGTWDSSRQGRARREQLDESTACEGDVDSSSALWFWFVLLQLHATAGCHAAGRTSDTTAARMRADTASSSSETRVNGSCCPAPPAAAALAATAWAAKPRRAHGAPSTC